VLTTKSYKGRLYTEKRKNIFDIKREKRENKRVCKRTIEEGITNFIQTSTNSSMILTVSMTTESP